MRDMIYVVGHTAIDHISRVPTLPAKNGSTSILERVINYGGGAANIAAGIAKLGGSCTLVSAVGGDFAGSGYDRWMDSLGICRSFFIVPEAHTPTAFMFTDQEGHQMTFFEWGASKIFSDSVAPELPFVHMATADPGFNVQVAKKAGFASFDPGQDLHRYSAEELSTIMEHIRLLFANHHEIEEMSRIMGVGVDEICARVPMAVITMGAKGSTLLSGGREYFIPAIPVEMADPTGAGDSYRAGFLTAFCRGFPPLTCCRIGTVTASYVIEKAGCQTNLPDWGMMATRYQNFFGRLDTADILYVRDTGEKRMDPDAEDS